MYDVETGLYFLKTRYYDPTVGRFINADEVSYIDPETIGGLNLYAYCGNNPIMRIDPNGTSFWSWLWSGLLIVGGALLCFVPGGQGLGVALIAAGISSVASNIMSAAGVDSKTATQISAGLNIFAGAILLFTPLAPLGASLIGSGVGSFAGGYVSEALGGSYELGATIGSIGGSIVGGHVYNHIRFSKIAKQGIVIGKNGKYTEFAQQNRLANYDGLSKYNEIKAGFSSVLGNSLGRNLAQKLGWANNYHYISNVMKHGGIIVDIGGELTGAYAKEIILLMAKSYQYVIKGFLSLW